MPLGQVPLGSQLCADEADRHDPVLLSCSEQAVARPVSGGLVLERHLTEPRQSVPDVRRVVDRQPPAPGRVDVGKGAVGKLRALLCAEPCHHPKNSAPRRSISSGGTSSITWLSIHWWPNGSRSRPPRSP